MEWMLSFSSLARLTMFSYLLPGGGTFSFEIRSCVCAPCSLTRALDACEIGRASACSLPLACKSRMAEGQAVLQVVDRDTSRLEMGRCKVVNTQFHSCFYWAI